MKALRNCGVALVVGVVFAPVVRAQEPPKVGAEQDIFKKMEGNWDLTMKFGGAEAKGTVNYKLDLGGLLLVSTLESELFGSKFSGRGLDTYDAQKKKYVAVWVDSMSSSPMVLEGTFDKATRTMTMTGDGPGQDGKATKYKSVTAMPDDDTINFGMYIGETKEPTFTIVYKRKK